MGPLTAFLHQMVPVRRRAASLQHGPEHRVGIGPCSTPPQGRLIVQPHVRNGRCIRGVSKEESEPLEELISSPVPMVRSQGVSLTIASCAGIPWNVPQSRVTQGCQELRRRCAPIAVGISIPQQLHFGLQGSPSFGERRPHQQTVSVHDEGAGLIAGTVPSLSGRCSHQGSSNSSSSTSSLSYSTPSRSSSSSATSSVVRGRSRSGLATICVSRKAR
jgi:hypothetical protein